MTGQTQKLFSTRHYNRWAIALLASWVFMTPVTAPAQDIGEILLSAQSNRTIDQNSSFDVRLLDDSDLNLRLRKVLIDHMKTSGFAIDSKSPSLVLWLKTHRITWSNDQNQSIGSLRVGSTVGGLSGSLNDPRGSTVDFNVKLWSSTQKSLLKKNSPKRVRRQGLQMVLDIFDVAQDAYIWRGSARTAGLDGDSFNAGKAMAPRLIEIIGDTVEPTIMELY
ncbi:MAG: hypothetical protein JKY20_06300 [Alphaproteobacteria bacterium]|nr:hypothetical protein [Alphaproteobacteria bacterium]